MVSGPYDEYLEYYSIVVPDGAFTSRLCRLEVGDRVWMDQQNHGFLTLDRFPLEGDLWMLASGTGLAPFMSLLADPLAWESFDRLLLVHSVRESKELAYQDTILSLGDHPTSVNSPIVSNTSPSSRVRPPNILGSVCPISLPRANSKTCSIAS